MDNLNRVDPSTLGWVKTEIDQTLEQARSALAEYGRERSDTTPLRMYANHLHQVVGTLQMVELDGAAQLAQEVESLADSVIGGDHNGRDLDATTALLDSSLFHLSGYLERLQHGMPDLPVQNVAILNELRSARGEVPVDVFDLFNPDLDVYPPRRRAVETDDGQARAEVRRIRRGFQGHLLDWLRDNDSRDHLLAMAGDVSELQSVARLGRCGQLWWIARAFLEMLGAECPVAADDPRKRLLSKLDQAMRLLVEHGEAALARSENDELLKQLLFAIGRSSADLESVAEIKRAFNLDLILSSERTPVEGTASLTDRLREFAGTVTGELQQVETSLTAYSEDSRDASSLDQVIEGLARIGEQVRNAPIPAIKDLVDSLLQLAGELREGGGAQRERATLQMAAALLFLSESLSAPDTIDVGWSELAAEKATQLQALQGGRIGLEDLAHEVGSGGAASLSDYEIKRLLGAVAGEIYVNLNRVEEALEQFALDGDTALLEPTPDSLSQVEGALRILGQHKVCDLIQATSDHLRALMSGRLTRTGQLMDALAVAVGTVESYVRGLEHQRPRLRELVERALQDLENAFSEVDLAKIDPHVALSALQQHLEQWLRDSGDYAAFRAMRQQLRDLSMLARRRDKSQPHRLALEMNNLLDIVTEDPTFLSPEVEQTLRRSLNTLQSLVEDLVEPAPVAVEGAAVAVTEAVAPTAAAAVEPPDQEILEIFREEARECVQAMETNYRAWRRDPADEKALSELRRQFHTVKGSGRTARAGVVAELAWLAEDVLNQVLDGKQTASEELFAFTHDAQQAIDGLLRDELRDPAQIDLAAWQQRRDRLSQPPARREAASTPLHDDAVIEIFTQETRGHVATLREFVARCKQNARECAVAPDLSRAVHTLMGSSRSLQLNEMADAFNDLDRLLQTLGRAGEALQAGELEIVERLAVLSLELLDALPGQRQFGPTLRRRFVNEKERIRRREQERRERREQVPEPLAAAADAQRPAPVQPRTPPASLDDQFSILEKFIPQEVAKEIKGGEEAPVPSAPVLVMDEVSSELRDVFFEEASDLLQRMNREVGDWGRGQGQGSRAVIAALKRDLHTLKGSARAAGASIIGDLSHTTETLLERVPVSDAAPAAGMVELVEEVQDTLMYLVRLAENRQPMPDITDLMARVSGFATPAAGPTAGDAWDLPPVSGAPAREQARQPLPSAVAPVAPQQPELREVPTPAEVEDDTEGRAVRGDDRIVRVRSQVLDKLVNYAGEVSIARAQIQQQLIGLKANLGELRGNVARFSEELRELDIQADSQIRARNAELEESQKDKGDFDPLEFDRYTRLQQLSRSLSESLDDLVTIQAGLNQFANQTETVLQQQAHLSLELQDGLMSARLVPFSTLIQRLRHHARQTARELDKSVDLSIVGGEVEVDRNVLEGLTEALEHMVRNAIDHGIESQAERSAAGKPDSGQLSIDCRQEGKEVVIRFRDDGAGLDVGRIRAKAIETGLLQPGTQLTDQDLIQVIVVSGFSTTEEVTKLSGRGVGMDVVNNTVRRFGGSIMVESEPGQGTTFVLRLPQSLSIAQALFVRCGAQEFAISLGVIERIVKAGRDEVQAGESESGLIFRYEGQVYPVMDLTRNLGLETAVGDEERIPLLIVRMGARDVAVQVDALIGTHEIVVKNLGAHIAALEGVSGATIRGDGSVVLILDLAALWLAEERRGGAALLRRATERNPVVMVVDDSLTVRKVTSRNLNRYGIEVMMARDGVDALEQMKTTRPDVMLVDIEMPRMDGYELIERVRADTGTRGIPIIVITSRAGPKHREKAMELGANEYLTKPYQEDVLLSQVQALLGTPVAAPLAER
jgi:chemosensory pili system protein ChpA (sensor histidine kinase/response regulator)